MHHIFKSEHRTTTILQQRQHFFFCSNNNNLLEIEAKKIVLVTDTKNKFE